MSQHVEDSAVTNFREYLRIPSVHPNINYDECVAFIRRQAASLGLPVRVYSVVEGKPIVIITWQGTEPTLPSIYLNSHMDVVPAFEDLWTHPPFGAEKDEKGNIYGRGSQDMKCVGIQYIEAVRRLKKQGLKLKRTVHISFAPDEEIGSQDGLEKFVHTAEFKELNVGFAMDEGGAVPFDWVPVFYGERCSWHIWVHCPGPSGHGCQVLNNTAGEKLNRVMNSFLSYGQRQKDLLVSDPVNYPDAGCITGVNLTIVKGGELSNLVPPKMSAMFDCRLTPDQDHEAFEAMVRRWCVEAGDGITYDFVMKFPQAPRTKIDDTSPWWAAFSRTVKKLNYKVKPIICIGGTDMRHMRKVGIPALGFSPMENTPVLLHDHDEYVNEKTFLNGIKIYEGLIEALANVN